jgi:HD-GYP domain-containing protein (c-di-GMP phosphodiesterase class II)
MQISLRVDQLTKGMYVAELDIPWLDSPFLFQGFTIETDDELDLLAKHCRHVVVDDMKSRDSIVLRRLLSLEMRAATRPAAANDVVVLEEVGALRRALNRVDERHERGRSQMISAIDDVRLGRILETRDAKAFVGDLVSAIASDAGAAWLLSSLRERSPQLADHCLNTAIIATAFAQHLGYGRERCEVVGLGALLHDIGLARVPKAVLEKAGELDVHEYALVKLHPAHGERILNESRGDLDRDALDIVLLHHERVNRRGYPRKLEAACLPEHAQVVALADVYDSMISRRPYAAPRSPQEALSMINSRSGIDFEPRLVAEFIKCVGIYPAGSPVQLMNGALGIVVSSRPEHRLTPTLLMVRDPAGREILPRKTVNLKLLTDATRRAGWSVARIVDAAAHGINVGAVIREALGRT